eukprot:gene24806-31187_t
MKSVTADDKVQVEVPRVKEVEVSGKCKLDGCEGKAVRKDLSLHFALHVAKTAQSVPDAKDNAPKKRKHEESVLAVDSTSSAAPSTATTPLAKKTRTTEIATDTEAETTPKPDPTRQIHFRESDLPGTLLPVTYENYQRGFNTYHYPDGGVYQGMWHEGKRSGHGVWSLPNGSVYGGGWLKDVRHGHGELYFKKDMSGVACEYSYVGQWFYAKREGHGVETWADGTRYTGNFHHDKAHGMGVLLSPADRFCYMGHFLDGKMHGHCLLYHFSGKVEKGVFFE